MRHHNQNRKLGRERKQRRALLNSLARSLMLYGKIKTTEAKAKEVRPFVEKLITKAKAATLTGKRVVAEKMGRVAAKKTGELGKKYADRKGGYTRITKIPRRKSDGSKMAVIELV